MYLYILFNFSYIIYLSFSNILETAPLSENTYFIRQILRINKYFYSNDFKMMKNKKIEICNIAF